MALNTSKKMISTLRRERKKIERNLSPSPPYELAYRFEGGQLHLTRARGTVPPDQSRLLGAHRLSF